MTSPDRRPQISLAQVAGSALAAVSAAVVASFLGVGGTVLGAAVGSLFATVGGAVYAHSFRRAGEKLGETKVLTVVTRSRTGRDEPGPGDLPLIEAPATDSGDDPNPPYAESGRVVAGEEAEPELVVEAPQRPRWMRWQTGVVLAVVAFVIAMLVISVIELTIGGPISGGSGGTTVGQLVRPSTTHHTPKPTPTPSPTSTSPVVTPTGTPTTAAPTSTPTSPAPTETATPPGTATTSAPAGPATTPTG